MVISLVYKNQGRQVIDLIFMGRLTLERSQIQEQSELVLTTVTWGGGHRLCHGLVGKNKGRPKTKRRKGTVVAVSWGWRAASHQ